MIKENLKHWIGFVLLISIICFFFYKSVVNETSVDDALQTIENIQDLQVQLHRDLLRYRSNQIKGYDTLNKTQEAINKDMLYLSSSPAVNDLTIASAINEQKYGSSLYVSSFLPSLGSRFGSITNVPKKWIPLALASLATVAYIWLTREIFHVLPIARPSGNTVAPALHNPWVPSSIISNGILSRFFSSAIFWVYTWRKKHCYSCSYRNRKNRSIPFADTN